MCKLKSRIKVLKEDEMKEIKDCPGKLISLDDIVECRYFITEEGQIFDRYLDKFLSSHINTGYNRVAFRTKSGTQKAYYNHVLAGVVYLGDYRNTLTVNHEDGDKSNNHISNLKWMTHHENITHAITNGLIKNRTSLTEPIVRQVCDLIVNGESVRKIADILGLKLTTVEGIKNKYNWTNISDEYTFPPKAVYKMMSPELIDAICEDIKNNVTSKEIADKHNINIHTLYSFNRKYRRNIQGILNKKNYKKYKKKSK